MRVPPHRGAAGRRLATVAANIGLAITTVLLTYRGWPAGASELHGWRLAVATALWLAMVALKQLVLPHLH